MIHAVYDITECTGLDAESDVLKAMRETVQLLGCTILGELPVTFQPHGMTVVLVLAQSHLIVSTWPEHQLAHVDLFTCRADVEPEQAIAPILATLGGRLMRGQRVDRTGPAADPG